MARKPKPKAERQSHVVAVRVTAAQAARLEAAARKLALPVAAFARTVALERAARVLDV
jgi:hypothetical protein